MSERLLQEQDAKLTELIDAVGTAAFRCDEETLDFAKDALHEYIAELRGDSAALLDALEAVSGCGCFFQDCPAHEAARALLRKHGRLP